MMKDFRVFTNDEVANAKTDERILEEIIENYLPIINKVSRKYSKMNRLNDFDDLQNAGRCGVYYAVQHFDSNVDCSFGTYCISNIKWRILHDVRTNKKSKADATVKSLNVLVGSENGREDYLENLIESPYKRQDELVFESETSRMLWGKAKEVLTEKQFTALYKYFKEEKTHREIAKEENVSYQCIAKRIDSACVALQKVLNINDF